MIVSKIGIYSELGFLVIFSVLPCSGVYCDGALLMLDVQDTEGRWMFAGSDVWW